jgi:hypothetical protein
MLTTFAATLRYCTSCRADVTFEQLVCEDGHGLDCPEWFCVQCGDAVVIGFTATEPVRHQMARIVA